MDGNLDASRCNLDCERPRLLMHNDALTCSLRSTVCAASKTAQAAPADVAAEPLLGTGAPVRADSFLLRESASASSSFMNLAPLLPNTLRSSMTPTSRATCVASGSQGQHSWAMR